MRVLKLVIVDDEKILLKGLVETYDWASVGFQVAGWADSGEKAIEVIAETQPHLVLSDIRMKQIDGLMVMEETRKAYPETEFIFISAHRDFAYAQKACDMGAYTYLLKPIEEDKLMQTMKEVHAKCSAEIEKRERQSRWERVLKVNQDSFLQMTIQKYLENSIPEEEASRIFEMVNYQVTDESRFITVCVATDISIKIVSNIDYLAEELSLCTSLQKMFSPVYQAYSFQNREGVFCFLLKSNQPIGVQNIKIILENITRDHREIVSAISKEYCGPGGIKKSYEEAGKLFEIASSTSSSVFTADIPISRNSVSENYSVDNERLIMNALRKNDKAQLKDTYVKFVCELPGEEHMQKMYLHMLLLRVEFMVSNSYGYTGPIEDSIHELYRKYGDLQASRMVDVCYKILENIVEARSSGEKEQDRKYFGKYIEDALNYINENLADESLSIISAATHVYLNPVYFGRVFKNSMGVSFKQYLMQQRIDFAKQLLQDGEDSISLICEKIGISNLSYFSQVFKQYTGYMPTEYRKEYYRK